VSAAGFLTPVQILINTLPRHTPAPTVSARPVLILGYSTEINVSYDIGIETLMHYPSIYICVCQSASSLPVLRLNFYVHSFLAYCHERIVAWLINRHGILELDTRFIVHLHRLQYFITISTVCHSRQFTQLQSVQRYRCFTVTVHSAIAISQLQSTVQYHALSPLGLLSL
jgi:hypothetical protein